jgi:hypothetical protein
MGVAALAGRLVEIRPPAISNKAGRWHAKIMELLPRGGFGTHARSVIPHAAAPGIVCREPRPSEGTRDGAVDRDW